MKGFIIGEKNRGWTYRLDHYHHCTQIITLMQDNMPNGENLYGYVDSDWALTQSTENGEQALC